MKEKETTRLGKVGGENKRRIVAKGTSEIASPGEDRTCHLGREIEESCFLYSVYYHCVYVLISDFYV